MRGKGSEQAVRRFLHIVCLLATLPPGARAETETEPEALPPMVVTADRRPAVAGEGPFSLTPLGGEELRAAPQLRLDDILRNSVPGFSLFRRSGSRAANPTAQGVSLRDIGPSGAGRTLVLLDGIPLNDPFAGWVPWSRVPPSAIGGVVVQSGGGAGLFGNAALAGTIFLTGPETEGDAARLSLTGGSRGTYEASLDARVESGNFSLSTYLDRFETAGYPVLRADQRGPVDTRADADSRVWQSRGEWRIDDDTKLQVTGGVFEEERGNGTRLTHNSSTGRDVSVTLDHSLPDIRASLRLQAYAQGRAYRSTFSSVNADRTLETLALDQYDVPASAAGGSAVWSQEITAAHRFTGGVDTRWIEGETNERFFPAGGVLTRDREAGGRQLFAGVFMEDRWRVNDAVEVTAGGRVDYWRQYDGHRRERGIATGAVLRADEFAVQDGFAPNGRLGLTVRAADSLKARAAAYTGFRAPTLNELYRPFRVGNDITEANAALRPERLYGGELGLDWKPAESVSVSLTGFYNELHDAVGNVTIGEGPDTFDPGGFVPAGGVLRQRRNLDRVDVLGVEAKVVWQFAPDWRLRLQYLRTHPVVGSAPDSPALEGKRLAQASGQVAVAAVDWTHGRWQAGAQARYTGRQYEDDLNTLPLADFVTVDVSLGYRFRGNLACTLKVENLLNRETETGRTSGGLVSTGAPRLMSLGVTVDF